MRSSLQLSRLLINKTTEFLVWTEILYLIHFPGLQDTKASVCNGLGGGYFRRSDTSGFYPQRSQNQSRYISFNDSRNCCQAVDQKSLQKQGLPGMDIPTRFYPSPQSEQGLI